MFSPSPLALFDYFWGAPQTKQATRSVKTLGVTLTEALAMCNNSDTALRQGIKRGDVFVNLRGFYCFKREEDRSLGLVSHSYLTNQGPLLLKLTLNIFGAPLRFAAQVSSSPDYLSQWPGCFYCRTSFGEASFVGRNQTQTTKDSLDRTLSDTTTAKSTFHLSSEEREQLADAMREGEFDWAQSMLPGAAEQEETKPASQEVGNPKI